MVTTRYSGVLRARESVGGDDAGGWVGQDHTWIFVLKTVGNSQGRVLVKG